MNFFSIVEDILTIFKSYVAGTICHQSANSCTNGGHMYIHCTFNRGGHDLTNTFQLTFIMHI